MGFVFIDSISCKWKLLEKMVFVLKCRDWLLFFSDIIYNNVYSVYIILGIISLLERI